LIPFEWFRDHFLNELLPRWYEAAVTDSGFFHVNLDRDWTPLENNKIGTLVSQARLLYVFSVGFRLTHDPSYRDAVEAGARFLLAHFTDPVHGGYYWACDEEGQVLDDTKQAYGHAFVLFGLCHAFQITQEAVFLEAALDVYDLMRTRFRDPYGGLIGRMTRDWREEDGPSEFLPRSQNPMMHTFEAFLALAKVLEHQSAAVTSEAVLQEAQAIAEFLFLRRGEANAVPLFELYTKDWSLAAEEEGRFFSIGHQFEWAFLLSYGVECGLPTSFLSIGQRCLKVGLEVGYEAERGAVRAFADSQGQITREDLVYWDHAEALRALMHYVVRRSEIMDAPDLLLAFEKILEFVKGNFLDPTYGGWYASLDADATPVAMRKGSVWKLDYHQTALCDEALRLASDSQEVIS
jgi:mannose-6-phosphate isomerase